MRRWFRFPRSSLGTAALAARVRSILVRHRWWGRLVAAGGIGLGAWTGASVLGSMAAARDGWGSTVPVAVARVALAPGDHAGTGTVTMREWPAALVPAGALRSMPDAVVRQHVGAGEAVAASDVGRADGPAGMLPGGWVAVAVPLDETRRPPLATADRVGIVVDGMRATGGAVVEVAPGLVVVAVPAADAAGIAAAALDDLVGLVLEPPG